MLSTLLCTESSNGNLLKASLLAFDPVIQSCGISTPAHPDLANAAGVPARLASEKYVESLVRITYYWGYPAVDTSGRTNTWQLMKEPGATMGFFPGAPKNRMGYLDDYMPATQRKVVTPNNDTIYGAGLPTSPVTGGGPDAGRCARGPLLDDQIVDLFTTVTHQLGSASGTPGGKLLLVGPDWKGEKPAGFIDVFRSPTHVPACSAAASLRDAGSEGAGARRAQPDRHGAAEPRPPGSASSTARRARATRYFHPD